MIPMQHTFTPNGQSSRFLSCSRQQRPPFHSYGANPREGRMTRCARPFTRARSLRSPALGLCSTGKGCCSPAKPLCKPALIDSLQRMSRRPSLLGPRFWGTFPRPLMTWHAGWWKSATLATSAAPSEDERLYRTYAWCPGCHTGTWRPQRGSESKIDPECRRVLACWRSARFWGPTTNG